MKLYVFLFNYCIHESSSVTMSIHRTKKGAWRAMNKWINDRFIEEYNFRNNHGKFKGEEMCGAWKVGTHEWWGVGEIELSD